MFLEFKEEHTGQYRVIYANPFMPIAIVGRIIERMENRGYVFMGFKKRYQWFPVAKRSA
jgi:hypothetical protein